VGQRWGRTKGKIGFHGGKVTVRRPRVRSYDAADLGGGARYQSGARHQV
jgi:hypothetical protein